MAAARYTVHVPTTDELGHPLNLHEQIHQNFVGHRGAPVQTQHGSPTHAVSAWAEDIPEWDSLAKQQGTQAAQLANVPVVHVTKEGAKPATWEMANTHYIPGAGADESVLALSAPTGVHSAIKQSLGL